MVVASSVVTSVRKSRERAKFDAHHRRLRQVRHASCSMPRMHYVPFALKRAHHVTLKMLRPIAARHDLTPARFDLLNTLFLRDGGPRVFPQQNHIAKALGLCRTTICKMVAALEKAGFVVREVDYYDRRCRRVKLTCYGRRCLLRVLKAIRRHEVERRLLRPVCTFERSTRATRFAFISGVAVKIFRFNFAFGDGAQDIYPMPTMWNSRRIRQRHSLQTA